MVGVTTTASATSLNFVGFEEMRGKGTPALIYNQVFIMPNQTQTAGRYIHPVAGFIRSAIVSQGEAQLLQQAGGRIR